MKILIVDDNQDLADLVKEIFLENNHQVEVVYQGLAALNLLTFHEFDLLIIDIYLPDINGTEIISRVRKEQGTLPKIIAISGDREITHSTTLALNLGLYWGANQILQKPFEKNQLLSAVHNVFASQKLKNDFGSDFFQIKHQMVDEIFILTFQGTLDYTNSSNFHLFFEALETNPPQKVAINFNEVTHVDSTGIVNLISLLKVIGNKGANLVIYQLQPDIQKVLENMNIHNLVKIMPTENEALEWIKNTPSPQIP